MTKRRLRAEPRRYWTAEEDELLRREYSDRLTEEVQQMLPWRTLRSVYARAKQLGLRKSKAFAASAASGRLDGLRGAATRFAPGHATWNKGKPHPLTGAARETAFSKGNRPYNTVPVGTRTKSTDGYWKEKIGEPRQWQWCHRAIWERANGPIPEGMCVVFVDGNPDHLELDNLALVPRGHLMKRNSIHNYPQPIKQLVHLRGRLVRKINTLAREESPTP